MNMGILDGFNANDVAPSVGFAPIPEGTYNCMTQTAVEKPTKDGSGIYLEIELKIVDGPSQGRKFFHRFNLKNRNAQAVQIARGELSAFCRAIGVLAPKVVHEFANKVLRVSLKVEARRDDATKLANTVKAFEGTGQATSVSAAMAAPVDGPKVSPPWGSAQ